MGQTYRRMENQKPGPWLAYTAITWFLPKMEDLNRRLKSFPKMSKPGDVVSELVNSNVSQTKFWDRRLKPLRHFL